MQQVREQRWERTQPWLLVLGFALLLGLSTAAGSDLRLTGRYYDASRGWFLATAVPWRWLYHYGEYPTLILAAAALLGFLSGIRHPARAASRRRCLLVVLAVALGPGLLVNGLLKPLWGRPRPRQVQEFGGSVAYRPWWQPGGPGAGRSLPAGHAAMGYVLGVGVVLIPRRQARWRLPALAAALAYGSLMGFARLVQGAHFPSDVLCSGGVTYLTIAVLQTLLRPAASAPAEVGGSLSRPPPTP